VAADSFYEAGSTLLTPAAFEFVLDCELKRGLRSQNYLTLVTIEANREWDGLMVAADDGTLQDVAKVMCRDIRDTDALSHAGNGTLALLLLDADVDQSARVINRLISRLESYTFATALRIAVGAACCPTHAVDVDSLKREAQSRPVVSWRSGVHSPAGQTQPLSDQN
jgi:GGDEF domain-containing protein